MPKGKKILPENAAAPSSSCLLICDDVLQSVAKNKHLLHGVISQVFVPKLPALIGPYVAYVRLSNVHGSQSITLSLAHAATEEELFRFSATSPAESDPLATHTFILAIPPLRVTKAGRYIFEASHAGIPFATNAIEISTPRRKRGKS